MKSARIFVPEELFAPAESSSFHGEYELASLTMGPDEYRFQGPLVWDVSVTNTGDALLLMGSVRADARTGCARCLEEFELALEGEVEGYFLLDAADQPPEDMDGDEYEVLGDDHVIDLEPLLVAALLLELPLVPLCDEDCKGLCPTCGENLNEGPCGCRPAEDDAFSTNPFAVLKDFHFEEQ